MSFRTDTQKTHQIHLDFSIICKIVFLNVEKNLRKSKEFICNQNKLI